MNHILQTLNGLLSFQSGERINHAQSDEDDSNPQSVKQDVDNNHNINLDHLDDHKAEDHINGGKHKNNGAAEENSSTEINDGDTVKVHHNNSTPKSN